MPATALAAAGVWAVAIASTAGAAVGGSAVAGSAFLCAWCFKQSDVGLLSATCLYVMVMRRSMRELAWLAAPFAIGGARVLIGGASYRANIITMPALNRLVVYLPVHWHRSIAVIDALLPWAMSGFALVVWLRRVMSRPPLPAADGAPGLSRELFGLDLTYLLLATVTTFALSLLLLAKVGAALNHALEFHVAASLLCTGVLAGAWRAGGSRIPLGAAAALVPMIALYRADDERPRARPARHGSSTQGLGDSLHLGSSTELADRAELPSRESTACRRRFTGRTRRSRPLVASPCRQHYPGTIIDHITSMTRGGWG